MRPTPSSASGIPVESRGSTNAAAEGSKSPSRPGGGGRAEREPRRVDEWPDRIRAGELSPDRREPGEEALPGGCARRKLDLGREPRGDGDSRAREAAFESQHPDPASVEDVVHRRGVDRIRRAFVRCDLGEIFEAADVLEVRVEPRREREILEAASGESEGPMKEPGGTTRVDDETRSERDLAAAPAAAEARAGRTRLEPVELDVSSRYSAPSEQASAARNASKSERSQCVSATSSFGLAATSSSLSRCGQRFQASPAE